MTGFTEQILKGKADWAPTYNYKLSYNRAHALVARDDDGGLMGWALVRHPSRRLHVSSSRYNKATREYQLVNFYGGRRPDFNVYVSEKYRQRGVAKDLLLVAYNNFGRVDAYPHDAPSISFYEKFKKFVTAYDTNSWCTAQFKTREVF